MRIPKSLFLMAFVAVFSFTSCTKDNIEEVDTSSIDLLETPPAKQIEIEIMELINEYRINKGLNPLLNHDTVKAVSHSHTEYMIETNSVSHDNFFIRKQTLQANTSASIVSENVAYGFNSAESVVNAWLASPSHKDNIEGDYSDFEISAEQNTNGKWFFTNMFIKR
ncbi:hypothetical protein DFQ11_102447 [Winogradskyella epiphytica]|uniref:SCP domain-containing protein n=1 Tax=Winogradskyella epiphytica TaxID=262005 RepID=A0A2V4X8E5_9FLAO|nr:CAP domain-containing protein [Winogradskyella epiphytica]PYE81869.1 hypothetical protein DFQ11_102447 [Winogradskyella epiphytica]